MSHAKQTHMLICRCRIRKRHTCEVADVSHLKQTCMLSGTCLSLTTDIHVDLHVVMYSWCACIILTPLIRANALCIQTRALSCRCLSVATDRHVEMQMSLSLSCRCLMWNRTTWWVAYVSFDTNINVELQMYCNRMIGCLFVLLDWVPFIGSIETNIHVEWRMSLISHRHTCWFAGSNVLLMCMYNLDPTYPGQCTMHSDTHFK